MRREQMAQLISYSYDLQASGSVLLVGDMNATPDLGEYTDVVDAGLYDSFAIAGTGCRHTWSNTNPHCTAGILRGEDCVMDYVFVLQAAFQTLDCRACEVVCNQAPWLSDHFGVRLVFRSVFPSFSAIFNRKMQKLPLFSCILMRNEGKNGQSWNNSLSTSTAPTFGA